MKEKGHELCNRNYSEEVNKILAASPFIFKGLDNEATLRALQVAEYTVKKYKPSEMIFDTESFSPSIAFVLSGEVSVYKSGAKRKTLLSQLRVGDSFGAASLFGDIDAFPTSIYATSSCKIMFISQDKMNLLVAQFPQIAINYIYFLSSKIRFLNEKINSFAASSAEEKTAKFLIQNCRENEMSTPLNMTQISSALGIGRASFYRILTLFEKRGAIERTDSKIIIKDIQKLKNISKEKENNND